MTLYTTEGTKAFTWCQLGVSSSARIDREREREVRKEAVGKSKRVKKVIGLDGAR